MSKYRVLQRLPELPVSSEWLVIAREKTMNGNTTMRRADIDTGDDVKIPSHWLMDRTFFLCLDNEEMTDLFIDNMHIWMQQNGCFLLPHDPLDSSLKLDWHIDMNELKLAIMALDYKRF